MLINTFKKIVLSILVLTLLSCDCGESVNLGYLPLEEGSIDFVTYEGSEKLVFIDQDNREHILSSQEGVVYNKFNVSGEEECHANPFDIKDKYYLRDHFEIYFYESEEYIFSQSVTTTSAAETAEAEFILLDQLIVRLRKDTISIDIGKIISDRGNIIPQSYKDVFINELTIIGDTTLYGKDFKNVNFVKDKYEQNTTSILFYSLTQGILAIKFDENRFWVLDRVE